MNRFLGIVSFLALLACQRAEQPYTERRLPSGRTIHIYKVERVYLKDLTKPPVLMLTYRTSLPPHDSEELRAEAREIWEAWKPDVEASKLPYAAIRASELRQAPVYRSAVHTYIVKKDSAGHWRGKLLDTRK